jgi:hypothetical protein
MALPAIIRPWAGVMKRFMNVLNKLKHLNMAGLSRIVRSLWVWQGVNP